MLFYDLNKKEVTSKNDFKNEDGVYFLDAIANDESDEGKELLKKLGFSLYEEDLKEPKFNATSEELEQVFKYDEKNNKTTLYYEVKPKELEAFRLALKELTDLKRDESIEAGIEYKGKIFQSGEKDRNLLTSTISLFSLQGKVPDGFVWIAKDNSQVPFTLKELIELGTKMAQAVELETLKARALKDKIASAKDYDELKGILNSLETTTKEN